MGPRRARASTSGGVRFGERFGARPFPNGVVEGAFWSRPVALLAGGGNPRIVAHGLQCVADDVITIVTDLSKK